jgi:hypothetical protein
LRRIAPAVPGALVLVIGGLVSARARSRSPRRRARRTRAERAAVT